MSNSSLKDDQYKSWGVSQPPIPYHVSPTVTWGTLSTSSSSSTSSWQGVIDHKTSWSSSSNVVGSPQGWASNPSPPLYPSLGSPPNVGSHSGYPSPSPAVSPSSAGSWTQLNPLLDSRSPQCLNIDIGALQYMPNNGSATHPPVTFMQLLIVVPPFRWHVNIQFHSPLTVSQVVQHLFEFLQGYPNAPDLQKSKVIPSGYDQNQFREQNHPNRFHSGQRRIDLLGRHRIFRGLSLESGSPHTWVVHLSDR